MEISIMENSSVSLPIKHKKRKKEKLDESKSAPLEVMHVKNKKKKKKNSEVKTNSKELAYSENWKQFLENREKEKAIQEIKNKTYSKNSKSNLSFSKRRKRKHTGLINADNKKQENENLKTNGTVENGNEGSLFSEKVLADAQHTKFIAIDCEMVGVGINGQENVLARVSLVNSKGDCIYDTFVKPKEKVIDYRTHVSGVRPNDLKDAPDFEKVQEEVHKILKDKIIVGHALENDLKVLMLSHSRRQIRDTQKYKPLQQILKTKKPALRKLVSAVLNETIQSGEHSSIVDARASMKIYQKFKKEWEKSFYAKTRENKKRVEIFIGHEANKEKNKIKKWKKRKARKED